MTVFPEILFSVYAIAAQSHSIHILPNVIQNREFRWVQKTCFSPLLVDEMPIPQELSLDQESYIKTIQTVKEVCFICVF